MRIQLYNQHPKYRLPQKKIKKILEKIINLRGFSKKYSELNFYFIDDDNIKKLKKRYFGKNIVTDVISFPVLPEFGEIVLSVDTALRQARDRDIKLFLEIILLCIHGILHLNGFLDEDLMNWKRMKAVEFETLISVL